MMRYSKFKKYVCLIFLVSIAQFFTSVISAEDEYLLGVGDKIRIQVYQEPDLSFDITIDNSGKFSYPYLKQITLVGKSIASLENEIESGLKRKVLVNPSVTVILVEYRPFSIGGEVIKPGSYPTKPGLTVRKAINLAGGVTAKGSVERFELERAKPVEGEQLDLSSRVLPGDTVTVLQKLFINIGGEVKNPGSYPYEPELTVKRAINLAGGATEWSTGKKFKLERAKPTEEEKHDLNSQVYPGDTLTVLPRRLF